MQNNNVDFEGIAAKALEDLRTLYRATRSPEVRKTLASIASALDTIEGDRQFLNETLTVDEQQAWRDKILSY
jgi:hypothetical protein